MKVLLSFEFSAGERSCVYRHSSYPHIRLCRFYQKVGAIYSRCGLFERKIRVRGKADGLEVAQRCDECLDAEDSYSLHKVNKKRRKEPPRVILSSI